MWCQKCHYGSSYYKPTTDKCNQCGADTRFALSSSPFPKKPIGMGKGPQKKKTAADTEE